MFLEFFPQMVLFCLDSSILSHKCCGKHQTFFKLSLIQWNELIIFWRCLFVFPLNGHTIAAFDLTKALLPFPTCLLVCVTLGFTPSITQNKRIALTHKTQESEILELQIILLSSGQLHKSLNNWYKQMCLISCLIHGISFLHLSCSAYLKSAGHWDKVMCQESSQGHWSSSRKCVSLPVSSMHVVLEKILK